MLVLNICLSYLQIRAHNPAIINSNLGRVKRERETNKMQLIWSLLWNFYLNMFRSSLCPSSREQEYALPHMVFCTGCDGCGCVELGRKLCALSRSLFEQSNSDLQSAHSLRPSSTQPQPSQPVQNTICGSAHSCSPDDGHNDDRNMLR